MWHAADRHIRADETYEIWPSTALGRVLKAGVSGCAVVNGCVRMSQSGRALTCSWPARCAPCNAFARVRRLGERVDAFVQVGVGVVLPMPLAQIGCGTQVQSRKPAMRDRWRSLSGFEVRSKRGCRPEEAVP